MTTAYLFAAIPITILVFSLLPEGRPIIRIMMAGVSGLVGPLVALGLIGMILFAFMTGGIALMVGFIFLLLIILSTTLEGILRANHIE